MAREVLLVVETSYFYYVDADSDAEALEKATEMLDNGEPDQNPACGWLKVVRHQVETVEEEEEVSDA